MGKNTIQQSLCFNKGMPHNFQHSGHQLYAQNGKVIQPLREVFSDYVI